MLPTRTPSTRCTSSLPGPPCVLSWAPTGEPDDPPTSWPPLMKTPGIMAANWYIVPPFGIDLIRSGVTARAVTTPCTSTSGDSPVTVTVSATAPTFISALIAAVKLASTSTPSRLIVPKPGSVKLTAYVPTGRLTTAYAPAPSVVTERTFSIKAGLETSTDTPGSTAPVASLTVPAIVPSVWAEPDAATPSARRTSTPLVNCRMVLSGFTNC